MWHHGSGLEDAAAMKSERAQIRKRIAARACARVSRVEHLTMLLRPVVSQRCMHQFTDCKQILPPHALVSARRASKLAQRASITLGAEVDQHTSGHMPQTQCQYSYTRDSRAPQEMQGRTTIQADTDTATRSPKCDHDAKARRQVGPNGANDQTYSAQT